MKINDVILEQGLLRRFGDYLDRKGGGKGDRGRQQTANPRSVARDEYLKSLQKLSLEGFIDHFRQQGTYTEKEYRNLGKVAWDRYKVYRDSQGLDPKTAMSNAIADAESGKSITTPAQPAQAPVQQPAAQIKQTTPVAIPKTTKAGVQLISRTPQIHLRYKKQDFFLKTDPSGVETFVNLAGKKVPDQTQEFLMNQLQQL